MEVLFYKILMMLTIGVLRLCDTIFDIFMYLAGINDVQISEPGNNQNLLNFFVSNANIKTVFAWIVLIAIIIGAVFTMVALTKSMFMKTKKTQMTIARQYFTSIISMLFVFSIILLGIWAVSLVLQMCHFAFTNGDKISSQNSLTIGSRIMTVLVDKGVDIDIHNTDIKALTDEIVGTFKPNRFTGFEDIKIILSNGLIDIRAFPYFVALLCVGVLCWASFSAILGLIVRLYDIVFLTLVMPLPLAAYPLDDGARFKLWRETMISKMLLAFGTIFAVNIYIILVGEINKISLPSVKPFVSQLFRILLIVCGGFTISAGQLLFARIMGTDAQESRQMAHNFRNVVGGIGTTMGLGKGAFKAVFGSKSSGAAGMAGAAAGIAAATKVGGALGQRGGVVGTAAKVGGAMGRVLGGNAYKAGAGKVADAMKDKLSGSKERFMNNGGLVGAAQHKMDKMKVNMTTQKGSMERALKMKQLENQRASSAAKNQNLIKDRFDRYNKKDKGE